MTTTAWSHLPNAKHIDRVLASLETHPEKWSVVRSAAWRAARETVEDAAWDAVWRAAREMAWKAAWDAALRMAREASWDAARGAIVALIAYDDCAYMLNSNVGELKIIATLGDPRAILLLPACIIFNEMKIA